MDKVCEDDKARESHVCMCESGSVSVYMCAASSPPLKHGTALGNRWTFLVRVLRASFFPYFFWLGRSFSVTSTEWLLGCVLDGMN